MTALIHKDLADALYLPDLRCIDPAARSAANKWNAEHPDPLISLPAELAAECFRYLERKDCYRVSHVSRAWRTAALADSSLWNSNAARWPPHVVDAFSTLLSPSHPAPFHFRCHLYIGTSPEAMYELLASNMHRMAEIWINDRISSLVQLLVNAPLLKFFEAAGLRSDSGETPVLPAQWLARSAPCLQKLQLHTLRLPSDCLPFNALRYLNVTLPPGEAFDIVFCQVFPNLTVLKL